MLDTMKNRKHRPRRGDREVRRAAGQGRRRAGAGRRFVDNVPGVPGIGIKTAAELINEYGDLDTLLARAGEIKQPKRRETLIEFADQARLSRELVRLKDDVAVGVPVDALGVHDPDPATLLGFLRVMEFRTLTRRIAEALGAEPPPAAEPRSAAPPLPRTRKALPGASAGEAPAAPAAAETPQAGVLYAAHAAKTPFDRSSTRRSRRASASRRGSPTRYAAGRVAFDTETTPRRDAAPSSSASRWRSRRARPATSRSATRASDRASTSASGDAAADTRARGARPAEAAAGGRRRPQDRPEHQVRHHRSCAQHGIGVAPIDDTMLISYALDGGMGSHGMDELAERHLGHTASPSSR